MEKVREFQKNIYFCFIYYTKALTVWIKINFGKFFKRWGYQTILSTSLETWMQIKKQQLEPSMEQWTGSKLGKEYIKAVYCHPAYLTYMQSTSCEMLGWMNHKMESRLPGEISATSICRWYHSNGRKWRGTIESLEGEREWKSWLQTQRS